MHLLVERVFDYTDQFNPHGPITEWLDRPLRDANTREIQLTEEVTKALRELKPHTDKSIHDKIPNSLIRDANDKSGFMNMNRMNLRVLMLNMGNWSNMRKLLKGSGSMKRTCVGSWTLTQRLRTWPGSTAFTGSSNG
jgi:hypothetical protein